MISFKNVWPWNKFERYVVFSEVNKEVNFFIREFLEFSYFPSAFIVVIESLEKRFLRSVCLKNWCFENFLILTGSFYLLLEIKSIISSYKQYYMVGIEKT